MSIWRSSVRRHPTIVYQTAWILANCLTLILGCGANWVSHVNGQPTVNVLADWTCRTWQAMFGVVKYVGGWTIVAMLAERYLATRKPQLAREYCSTCFVKVGPTQLNFNRPRSKSTHLLPVLLF